MDWDGNDRRRVDPVLAKLSSMGVQLDRLVDLVDGSNGQPGMRIQVDRLEVDKKRGAALHLVWAAAAISAAVAYFIPTT